MKDLFLVTLILSLVLVANSQDPYRLLEERFLHQFKVRNPDSFKIYSKHERLHRDSTFKFITQFDHWSSKTSSHRVKDLPENSVILFFDSENMGLFDFSAHVLMFQANGNVFNQLNFRRAKAISFDSDFNSYNRLSFRHDTIYTFRSYNDTLRKLDFYESLFKTSLMEITGTVGSIDIDFDFTPFPDTMVLQSVSDINIGCRNGCTTRDGGKMIVRLTGFNAAAIVKMNYLFFDYDLGDISLVEKIKFHSRLLTYYRDNGTLDEIKKADVNLKNYQVKNGDWGLWFQKILWEYGYSKSRLISWALAAFSLFYIINLLAFNRLVLEVYSIKSLVERWRELQAKNRLPFLQGRYYLLVLMYSSLIFFGIKMDPDSFPYKRLFWTMYLWFFYLIGLLLVFYIVGLILVR